MAYNEERAARELYAVPTSEWEERRRKKRTYMDIGDYGNDDRKDWEEL